MICFNYFSEISNLECNVDVLFWLNFLTYSSFFSQLSLSPYLSNS